MYVCRLRGKGEKVMNTKCAAAFGFAAQLAVLLPIPWGNKPCPRPGITHGKTHFMGHELQSCQRFGGKRGKWPTETAQKLIMAATLQCQKKDYGREKEEAQSSNYHQNPISWISGHGRPFWIVLVQLPAFCQRLFGKLIPQKVSQTCDLKQSANPFPVRHFTQLQSPFCPFGSCCSCCLPHH